MLRLMPSLIRPSTLILNRFTSRSSKSNTHNEPKVQLHPGNQYTVEEIAQGIPGERKRQIEELYEFEKLEINNQPSTRDEYRHDINRLFRTNFFKFVIKFIFLGGKKGVFDLEDILQILRDERLRDICVIEIPPEKQYAKYLIIATAFSARHLQSTSEYINKLVRNNLQKTNFFDLFIV